MQVPSANTATMTTGAEHASAGASPDVFGGLARTHSDRKAQLPQFVAIFTEQSVHTSTGNNPGTLAGLVKDASMPDEAGLPGATNAEDRTPVVPLFGRVGDEDGAQDHTVSEARASKNESRVRRHGTTDHGPIAVSGEKRGFHTAESVSSSEITTSTALIAAHVAPNTPSENSRPSSLELSLQAGQSIFTLSSSVTHASVGDERVQQSVSMSSEVAPERTLREVDSFKENLRPQEMAPTQLQSSPLRGVSASSEAAVPIPVNRLNGRQVAHEGGFPSTSGFAEERSISGAVLAGSETRKTISQPAAVSLSKPKSQEKTTGDPVRNVLATISASGASSVDGMQPHGTVSAMKPVARMVDLVSSDSKYVPAISATDTFQRLDSGSAPATLLHSSAHQLAVGVHDPSLGWLQVQTQSSAGHINATLTAGSAEAHSSLAAQASAITQYLADRDVSVHSLNVHVMADQHGVTSGGGESQSGAGNNHHEMQEQRGVGLEGSSDASFSEISSENMPPTETASYISIRA